MENLQKNNSYFKPLTGVRAIAAFMVYLHHFNPIPKEYAGTGIYNFVQEMHVGVTLFFVLSGFLIAYRYSDMNNFSFKKYMINRMARIYPMFFILTTLTFIVIALENSLSGTNGSILYLLNMSFLKGFFEDFKFSGIAQGWSLTVEETFYLIAPLIFILLKRSKLHLFLLPIFVMSIGFGLVSIFSKVDFYGFFSTSEFMLNYTFWGRCFEFFIGIGLAIVYKSNLLKSKFSYFTYAGVIGIIVSIISISLFKGNNDFGIRHPVGKLINTFLLPLAGVSIFYYGLLKEKTLISKVLGSRLFVLLGKSSYIFYLIHLGIFASLLHNLTSNYILIFISINVISIVLYSYIEEPLNNYLRNKLGGIAPVTNKELSKTGDAIPIPLATAH